LTDNGLADGRMLNSTDVLQALRESLPKLQLPVGDLQLPGLGWPTNLSLAQMNNSIPPLPPLPGLPGADVATQALLEHWLHPVLHWLIGLFHSVVKSAFRSCGAVKISNQKANVQVASGWQIVAFF